MGRLARGNIYRPAETARTREIFSYEARLRRRLRRNQCVALRPAANRRHVEFRKWSRADELPRRPVLLRWRKLFLAESARKLEQPVSNGRSKNSSRQRGRTP